MKIRKLVTCFCIALIGTAVSVNADLLNKLVLGRAEFSSNLKTLGVTPESFAAFSQFKTLFGRIYESEKEELNSLLAFVENLELINLHEEKFLKGESNYELGITNLTDIGHSLLMSSHTGYIAQAKARSFRDFEYPATELPEYLNYVDQGLVTRVVYQGYCGACWAFSTIGALEAQLAKKNGRLLKLSEQNLIDCNKDQEYGNWGCNGGNMKIAFDFIKKNGGIDPFNPYPYRGRGSYPCKYESNKSVGTVRDFVELQRKNETELQLALYHIGPISLAIDASVPSFQHYKTGIYDDPQCSHEPNHAVLLIGYGIDPKLGPYWILKNSWGKQWGENGFFRLPRNQEDFCGISVDASYPVV